MQVLSWRPRALYFPNFASAEQCQSVIAMAKKRLKPSQLALRQGETVESTKGTRTRYSLIFIAAVPLRIFILCSMSIPPLNTVTDSLI